MRGKIEVFSKQKNDLQRKVGRPTKKFEDCSDRSKRQKVQELCASAPKSQLESAAVRHIKKPVSKIVRNLINSTATEFKEYQVKADRLDPIPLSVTEAVSVLVELDLSKHQHRRLQGLAKSRNANIFPPYNNPIEAKKQCYPDAYCID